MHIHNPISGHGIDNNTGAILGASNDKFVQPPIDGKYITPTSTSTFYGINVPVAPQNQYVSQPSNKYTYWWLTNRNFNSYKSPGIDGYSSEELPTGLLNFFPEMTTAVGYYLNHIVFNGQKDRIKQTGNIKSISYYRPYCSGFMAAYGSQFVGSSRTLRFCTYNQSSKFLSIYPPPSSINKGDIDEPSIAITYNPVYWPFTTVHSGVNVHEGDFLGVIDFLVGFHAISGEGHRVQSRYVNYANVTLWNLLGNATLSDDVINNPLHTYDNIYVPIKIEMEESPQFIILGDDFGAGYPQHRTCYESEILWDQRYNVGYQLSLLNSGSYQNASIGYNTSTDIKNRFHSDCISKSPKFVVIMCGYNDIASGISLNTFSSNMSYIFSEMKNSGIIPMMTSILSPDASSYNSWIRDNIGTYDGIYIDISSLYTSQYTTTILYPYPDDTIHLNDSGIARLASIIYNTTITPTKSYAKINKNRTYINPGTINFKEDSIYEV